MDFINEILSSTVPAGSFKAWGIFAIATVIYFIGEYKTKSTQDPFSFGFWLKDNWMNLVVSVLFGVLYNWAVTAANVSALVLIAVSGNWLLDIFLTWRYYMQNKK